MEFGYFKDVWRNHLAHGRGQYDALAGAFLTIAATRNDAKKVLTHVHNFMDKLTTKLKLKEVKIS